MGQLAGLGSSPAEVGVGRLVWLGGGLLWAGVWAAARDGGGGWVVVRVLEGRLLLVFALV